MAKEIQGVLQNFDLKQKLVAIYDDNANNNPNSYTLLLSSQAPKIAIC
jgi:hypothetical protein